MQVSLLRRATLLLLLASSAPALAEQYRGTVSRIVDGDTLVVRSLEQHISVRLEGVDAPDVGEPYAREAADSLGELCAQKSATVISDGSDPYGRVNGEVLCNGVNANEEQLRRGMVRLETSGGPVPAEWRRLEMEARSAKRGLWSAAATGSPWPNGTAVARRAPSRRR